MCTTFNLFTQADCDFVIFYLSLHIKGPIKKIIWMMIVLTLLGIAIYTLCGIINVYMDHPVDVVTRLERQSDLPFPAVTLCNLNPTRSSMLLQYPLLINALNIRKEHSDEEEKEREKRSSPIIRLPDEPNVWEDSRGLLYSSMQQAFSIR